MTRYAYRAIDETGAEQAGIMDADSEERVLKEIHRKNLYPVQVRVATLSDEWLIPRREVKRDRDEAEGRRSGLRRRHTRQKFVVRYTDGKLDCGYCYALNPDEEGFYLDKADTEGEPSGKTVPVRFSDLKAVFYVKTFDGKFDKRERFREWEPEGDELILEFKDGEKMRGRSLHPYNPRDARFHFVPKESNTNNQCVLVETSALTGVYTPEQYREKRRAEQEEKRKTEPPASALTQEESMGDFYFEMRNYQAALEQYELAAKENTNSRLRRKILTAQYNIGVYFIKRRDYPEALQWMEKVLAVDPRNAHAAKKASQLRSILDRMNQASKQP